MENIKDRARLNQYQGRWYPEVYLKGNGDWRVVCMGSDGWIFFTLPKAVQQLERFPLTYKNKLGFKSREDALDVLESYMGAGKTVIPVDVIERRLTS